MNKFVKNAAILNFFSIIMLSLSGCSSTITAEEAKAQYQSTGPGGYMYLTKRFEKVVRYSANGESLIYTHHADRTEGSYYVYQDYQTTAADGTTEVYKYLAYQTSETSGRLYILEDGELSQSNITIEEVKEVADAEIKIITDEACTSYLDLFEAEEGVTREYYREFDGCIRVVSKSSSDTHNYEIEHVITPQSALLGYSNVTYKVGESEPESSHSIDYVYNSTFRRLDSIS